MQFVEMKRDLKHLKDTVANVEELAAARQRQSDVIDEHPACANEEGIRQHAATAASQATGTDAAS